VLIGKEETYEDFVELVEFVTAVKARAGETAERATTVDRRYRMMYEKDLDGNLE